jgi:hypothetical protein
MILLAFRPLSGGTCIQVRGAYFRICADATLRGPDNEVAATYSNQRWHLGGQGYTDFHCTMPIYLRITHHSGERERVGPYEFIRASDGALYTNERCLGMYNSSGRPGHSAECWQEVALLSTAA